MRTWWRKTLGWDLGAWFTSLGLKHLRSYGSVRVVCPKWSTSLGDFFVNVETPCPQRPCGRLHDRESQVPFSSFQMRGFCQLPGLLAGRQPLAELATAFLDASSNQVCLQKIDLVGKHACCSRKCMFVACQNGLFPS